jgi:hypothetical protein
MVKMDALAHVISFMVQILIVQAKRQRHLKGTTETNEYKLFQKYILH